MTDVATKIDGITVTDGAVSEKVTRVEFGDNLTTTVIDDNGTKYVKIDATATGGGGTGNGDMQKATYDTNNNGIVDNADFDDTNTKLVKGKTTQDALESVDTELDGIDVRLADLEATEITRESYANTPLLTVTHEGGNNYKAQVAEDVASD